MAPVANRWTRVSALSTSSSGTAVSASRRPRRPRRVLRSADSLSARATYRSKSAADSERTACCSAPMTSGSRRASPVAAPLVVAAWVERRGGRAPGGEGACVSAQRVGGDAIEAGAADARGGAGEVLVDDFLRQPDGLEELRAAVGQHRRYPHLRDGLEQPFAEGLDDVVLCRRPVEVGNDATDGHLHGGVEEQVRVDGLSAVPDEQGQMGHLPRLAALHDQAHAGPGALAEEVVMHRCGRQERRDRRVAGVSAAIAEDQDSAARGNGLGCQPADAVETIVEAVDAAISMEDGGDRLRGELALGDVADRGQVGAGEDGMAHLQPSRLAGSLLEHVAAGAKGRGQRHHRRLPDRVDRRVGHLRKELLEVREERLGTTTQHGEAGRRSPSNRPAPRRWPPSGPRSVEGPRRSSRKRCWRRRSVPGSGSCFSTPCGNSSRRTVPLRIHSPVGWRPASWRLHASSSRIAPASVSTSSRRARVEPPLLDDPLFGDVEHAGLRRHHHEAVVGDQVPRRAHRPLRSRHAADQAPVGEGGIAAGPSQGSRGTRGTRRRRGAHR